MKLTHSLVAVGALGLVAATGSAAAAAPHTSKGEIGTVYLIQGVPGKTVTAKIGGSTLGLTSETVSKPLYLSTGKHTITFKGPAWTLKTSINVRPGSNTDVVIHRPASVKGKPVVNVYRNNLKTAGADKGRVVVAHTAVVPAADIIVDGQVAFANIANGEFSSADVPAGTHVVKVVPTGQKSPVILGPLNLPVQASILTRVFAVGQPSNNSMNVIVQTLPLLAKGQKAPTTVPLGSAGLVAHWHVATTRAHAPAAVNLASRRAAATASVAGSGVSGGTYALGALLLVAASALTVITRRRVSPAQHRAHGDAGA